MWFKVSVLALLLGGLIMASGYPDFEGQKSKLFTVADWAAVLATDKELNFYVNDVIYGNYGYLDYTVPAGKTLYVTEISFLMYASDEADADNNQIGVVSLKNQTDTTYHGLVGGNGGGYLHLSKPAVFTAGKVVRLLVWNNANHTCNVEGYAGGYEK